MTLLQIHTWLVYAELALAAVTVLALVFVVAPYGRHARPGWGPTMPSRLGWVVMESPSSLGFLVVFLLGSHRAQLVPLILLIVWQGHYLHRTFIYPLLIRERGKRVPVLVVALGFVFTALNAWVNATWISELGSYTGDWLFDPRFALGMVVFLVGLVINHRSDAILIRLRNGRGDGDGYSVPHGGLFRWVSCPNYLGEIIEWCGWALMTWSLAGAAFALYTIANLAPRALANHRWYRATFKDYPPERRALLPFLW